MVKNTLLETLNNYKNITVEPETAEVDISTYISVAGHGSFTEQIFYGRISALFEVANALKELFASSEKSYEGAISVSSIVFAILLNRSTSNRTGDQEIGVPT